MRENPLLRLRALGQSLWLDYISRRMIDSGDLLQLIEVDGLCGVTSNPSIFDKAIADSLHGQIAIASAKLAYQMHKEIFNSERFRKLAALGARPQRVLWASTSTKNPAYSDVKYVEPLIGAETINTLPPEAIDAYRDHGNPALRLEKRLEEAAAFLKLLPELGIDLDQVTQQLEDEGLQKFNQPYDALMGTLTEKCQAACGEGPICGRCAPWRGDTATRYAASPGHA